ncbi:hypothetical protein QEZ40_005797 [Streptomyces katrae]|uniref:Uncharacterized protein n=1 Tax=Streptomyces katrae TaxID=68223 RepID=A0ABT7H2N7_9ACTN|nr:hypothetical protein [Streptomyces katrae]MDK9500170.1 hypothetical protein [Streptomyces katrae]
MFQPAVQGTGRVGAHHFTNSSKESCAAALAPEHGNARVVGTLWSITPSSTIARTRCGWATAPTGF